MHVCICMCECLGAESIYKNNKSFWNALWVPSLYTKRKTVYRFGTLVYIACSKCRELD